MKADLLPWEDVRIEALRASHILDTPPDPRFDAITEYISEFCKAPVVLVSLVDKNRQWFKSNHGLEICETPRDQSICAHAILQSEIFIVPDTWEDERTRDNPLCTNEYMEGKPFRFYAGMPLFDEKNNPLGSLCILDYKPREFSPIEQKLLKVMASQVVTLIELNRHIYNQQILHDEMDHRVKNSLQSVISLIRLYASKADTDRNLSPMGREAFRAIKRRVESIALLHEELYQTDEIESVKLDTFLKKVNRLLEQSSPKQITHNMECTQMTVPSHQATAIGVIISEFSANSIKHAFPEGREGEISFSIKRDSEGQLIVNCRDNGIGGTSDDREDGGNSVEGLGLKLMEASASQIGGIMEKGPVEGGYGLDLTVPIIPHI
ncbi:two-component sensor histidine kinase [Litorimonas taeanensis]|uniref:Two-component sensor histidine kinase n=1 Tax=Litorimonas taeanensis TaxID=568099 RepID=A0A420WD00_9PROT|nr:histidine kinase dimerization/phosphoacceptor domain -containing protein [Litorimonas taeanensis]RKQ68899.1 two-component sensor histidine kinase [Litorimonas taeanensis]